MLTTALAAWGALLSTLLAIWNIQKDLRDRGRLRVEAYLAEWLEKDDETGEHVTKYEVEIIVTNVGRRSVTLQSLGVGRHDSFALKVWRKVPSNLRLHRGLPTRFLEAI